MNERPDPLSIAEWFDSDCVPQTPEERARRAADTFRASNETIHTTRGGVGKVGALLKREKKRADVKRR